MPVVTINDLPSIPSLANSDVLPIVGISTNTTYKVTTENLLAGVFPYTGSAIITGSLQVIGPIMADVLKVSIVSSSIVYSSGSNIFGSQATDVQQMTGSLRVNGNGEHHILGGNFKLGTINNATVDTDKFLVSDSGVIKYRTGTELLSDIGTIPVTSGGTGTTTTFTEGSVVFAGASGVYSQDNAGLFFDSANNRLGVNTASPSETLEIGGKAKVTTSIAVGEITPSATTGRIDAANDVVAFSTSDANYKKNVTKIEGALEKVKQINGVEFDWIENPEVHGNSGHDVGVIAQEIEKVLPEVVTTRENGVKAVKYEKIVSLLIEAIKDLEKQVEELKKK